MPRRRDAAGLELATRPARVEGDDAVVESLHDHPELLLGAHERGEVVDLGDHDRTRRFVGESAQRDPAPDRGAVGPEEAQATAVAHLADLQFVG